MKHEIDLRRWPSALGYDFTFTPAEGDPIKVSLELTDIGQLLDLLAGFNDMRRQVAEWTAWLKPFTEGTDWGDAKLLAWTDYLHCRVVVLVHPGPDSTVARSYRLLVISLLSNQIVHNREVPTALYSRPMNDLIDVGARWVRGNTWTE